MISSRHNKWLCEYIELEIYKYLQHHTYICIQKVSVRSCYTVSYTFSFLCCKKQKKKTSMAKAIDIKCPSVFNTKGDTTSVGSRWKKWVNGFDLYITVAGVSDDNQKRALMLHCAGEDVQEIVDTVPESTKTDTYESLKAALTNYFNPKQNKRYERHIFSTMRTKRR